MRSVLLGGHVSGGTVVDVGDRVAACLLGGAIGDALGAGIEFSSIEEITRVHGPDGITDYVEAYGRRGAITDDTQMTMFTTEGIIRASVRHRSRGICHLPSVVRHAYIRGYLTQGEQWNDDSFAFAGGPDGWLIDVEGMHRRRAPGNTCLGAMLKPGDDPVPRQSVVNLDSVESVSVGLLVERLGRLSDARRGHHPHVKMAPWSERSANPSICAISAGA